MRADTGGSMSRVRWFYLIGWGVLLAGFALAFAPLQTAPPPAATAVATPPLTPSPIPAIPSTPETKLQPIQDIFNHCSEHETFPCIIYTITNHPIIGSILLLIIGAVIIFALIPVIKIIEEKTTPVWRRYIFKEPAEIPLEDRPLEEYKEELEQSLVRQSIDPVKDLADYIHRMEKHAEPLHTDEEHKFVLLSGNLTFELKPLIGFAPLPDKNSDNPILKEEATFPDLTTALQERDPNTQLLYPAFALLGEPGAGKSTLLRKLARDVIKQFGANPAAPIPVFVSLSSHRRGEPLDFLREHWERNVRVGNFMDMLEAGRVWLFADGLNEMERKGYNHRIKQWRDFIHSHISPGKNRAIVACREADYGEGLMLPRLNIHRMNPGQIQEFLNNYRPADHETIWNRIVQDYREARGDLYRLAQVPFWLVIMADPHVSENLSRNRVDMLNRLVTRWLDYESTTRKGGWKALGAENVRQTFLENLVRLAWIGLSRSQNYEFSEQEALKILKKDLNGLDSKEALRAACSCSLLVKNHGKVKFYHQLLQEYFASREVARRFQKGKSLARLWRIPWRKWDFVRSDWIPLPAPPSTFWEEATVLATGFLEPRDAEKITQNILKYNPPLAARCILESDFDMQDSIREEVSARLRMQVETPRERLAARLEAGKFLGKLGDQRILKNTGTLVLPDQKTMDFIEPDWIAIPAGAFLMGSSEKDNNASEDERPAHLVEIKDAYKIARFPVTVAEYQCFMNAGGYFDAPCWLDENAQRWLEGKLEYEESWQFFYQQTVKSQAEAILSKADQLIKSGSWAPYQIEGLRQSIKMSEEDARGRWQRLEAQKRDVNGHAVRPYLWEEPRYAIPNLPVIGICWYEARAYALWLTKVLRQSGRIHSESHTRLPSEAEWEYAARGTDQRLWPWGNRWQEDRCNSLESRIQYPSPVGIFPRGLAPCGAMDMAGNVWEWCRDVYDPRAYQNLKGETQASSTETEPGDVRVLRGGSWLSYRYVARCAYRFRDVPADFNNFVGFRLVLSPF